MGLPCPKPNNGCKALNYNTLGIAKAERVR